MAILSIQHEITKEQLKATAIDLTQLAQEKGEKQLLDTIRRAITTTTHEKGDSLIVSQSVFACKTEDMQRLGSLLRGGMYTEAIQIFDRL